MIKRRFLINVATILLMVLSLATLSIYSLPTLLTTQLIELIQQQTGRTAHISNAQIHLSPLTIQLQNVAILEKNSSPFINFDNLTLQINTWQSILHTTLAIEKLSLTKPIVRIIQQKNGTFNFSDLIKNSSDSFNTIFPITITELSLSQGKLVWQQPTYQDKLTDINLSIRNFSTLNQENCQFNLQLSLESSGKLNWQGEANLNPLNSQGHITINQLKLARILTAIDNKPAFNLTGDEELSTDYKLSYNKQKFDLIAKKLKLTIHDFNYSDQTPVSIKSKQLSHETNLNINYQKNTWTLASDNEKINIKDFALTIDKTQLKSSDINLNNDIDIRFKPNDWLFTIKKATITSKQLGFFDDNFNIKSDNINHTSNYQLQFDKQKWHLLTNNSKLTIDNLLFDDNNLSVKLKKIAAISNIKLTNSEQFYTQQGQITAQNLQLFSKNNDKPLIEITETALQNIDLDLNNHKLTIKSILANNANIRSWLNEKGEINYQTLATKDNTKTTTEQSNEKLWDINIQAIDLKQLTGTFADQSQKPAVAISFNPVDLKIGQYTNKTGTKIPLQLNAGINKTGKLQLQGDIVLEPFSTQLMVSSKNIDLVGFRSYAEKAIRLDIMDGQLDTEGQFNANNEAFKFTGDIIINDFITRDKKYHRDFITWKKLTLNKLVADSKNNSYTAKALILDHPYSRVTIKKDNTTNFSNILINNDKKNNNTKKSKPNFKLDKLQIIDGSSDFTDRSLIIPFFAQIKELSGGANNISSNQDNNVKVSLKGNAFDFSPVDINGIINPYTHNYDLSLNFIGLPMPLISPYMVEFAGYKVEKGKMSLKLKYKIINNQLTATNNILIDQFELGEKVENPKAVSLPLELAVVLLKDADGKITIDVPITGSLDDPQFSLSSVISDGLLNVLDKVVSSPFNALSNLLNGEEEELSTISFKSGKTELDKTEQEKLINLAKILKERTALVLDIKGAAFEAQDWVGLKETALMDELKTLRADEINQTIENKKILAEYVELSNADYRRLLAEQFIKKFPHLAKKSLFGKPELIGIEGDFYAVAKQKLSDNIRLQPTRLKRLATQRAQVIASYLIQQCHVPNGQIFILDSVINPERNNQEINSFLFLQGH